MCVCVNKYILMCSLGFPGGSDGKEFCSERGAGSIPRLVRYPGEGATYSNILVWRIPQTEEPGGLQSMGSERV